MSKFKKLEFSEVPEGTGFSEEQIKFIHSVGASAGREEAQKKFDDYFSSIITAIKDIPGNTRDEVKKDLSPITDSIKKLEEATESLKGKISLHDNWLWGLTGAAAIIIIMIIIIFV